MKIKPEGMRASEVDRVLNFLAEAGQLKRVKRSGWWVTGIKHPESVAEHCFRCAVLGYLIAKAEKADPYKVLMMCLFNDIHEARINDLHKVGHRYIDFKKAEDKAYSGQISGLPGPVRLEMALLRSQYAGQSTREAVIARDADILECVLQAKEYLDAGNLHTRNFMRVGEKYLKSRFARKLFLRLKKWDSSRWWRELAVFER
ncbi:MAG: HD domain-containing protein [Candidatus Omnitrophota bacterium]|jgi:putative hydrolase of HD superfamily|nr:HD domain-containing protein [Candidatus Omnitrophota bacterium]MDD5525870.1 HD domain-containing protein [Candidatus Omnitrophota bacterium]